MAGTKAGGQAAAKKNKELYGADFYSKIGAKGGKKGRTGGFAANRELARLAGAKGGKKSTLPSVKRVLDLHELGNTPASIAEIVGKKTWQVTKILEKHDRL